MLTNVKYRQESAALRSVAFSLYARLAAFGECDAYKEQLHTNMISIILHTYDKEPTVQQVAFIHKFLIKAHDFPGLHRRVARHSTTAEMRAIMHCCQVPPCSTRKRACALERLPTTADQNRCCISSRLH